MGWISGCKADEGKKEYPQIAPNAELKKIMLFRIGKLYPELDQTLLEDEKWGNAWEFDIFEESHLEMTIKGDKWSYFVGHLIKRRFASHCEWINVEDTFKREYYKKDDTH